MQSQSPYTQSDAPASLPPLPQTAALQPIPQQPTPAVPRQSAVTLALGEQAKLRAKQAIVQYQNSPYQLSAAVQQVKADYLAGQFNITVNPVEN